MAPSHRNSKSQWPSSRIQEEKMVYVAHYMAIISCAYFPGTEEVSQPCSNAWCQHLIYSEPLQAQHGQLHRYVVKI